VRECGHREAGVHNADPLLLIGHDGASGVNAPPLRLVGGQGFGSVDAVGQDELMDCAHRLSPSMPVHILRFAVAVNSDSGGAGYSELLALILY
jgi:hypothetical protein